jgi:hypothetical protein
MISEKLEKAKEEEYQVNAGQLEFEKEIDELVVSAQGC